MLQPLQVTGSERILRGRGRSSPPLLAGVVFSRTALTMLRSLCLHILSLLWILMAQQNRAQADECSTHCDLAHGSCDEHGKCRCDPGWDGQYCGKCVRMPGCVHGSCHQPWQCMCDHGWAGKFCDKDIHICEHRNPCQNAAPCVDDREGEYTCLCPEGFYGRDCELKAGVCQTAGSPCRNGGRCQDDNGYASNLTCRCLAGFVGDFCETNVDDCLMRPCANGATCHDGINRFSCQCQAGFQGRFCTINIDDCAGNPCKNGGKCYDRTNDFECFCANGFTGRSCETLVPKTTPATSKRPLARLHKDFGEGRHLPIGHPRATHAQPTRSVTAERWSSHPSKPPGGGLLKISVKELVTQREAGLTETQLVTVAVLGVLTAVLVLTTGALVLRNRWRGRHRPARDQNASSAKRKGRGRECEVQMLSTVGMELRKSTEV
ncbi:protein delta homolog 2 [Rhinatrema bivittatum]|uniref:protein delta homolog 2 n=1 Tax=Rhinatrema bivittatum TaxID=194408 RepID=UPI00112C53F4|nr:protein delta homolog 2 [Rhinatrema bivittatum]XP_029448714.1 protein delta homolog 2 [Rhinatrema bivittatum]